MIQQYKFLIKTADGKIVPSFWAYRLYAALLEQLPENFTDQLHEQGFSGISQYIMLDRQQQQSVWIISLLTEDAILYCSPVLGELNALQLREITVMTDCIYIGDKLSAENLICEAQKLNVIQTAKLMFYNAASFKSNGRYMLFPTEELILHSIASRWNLVFPEMTMDDEDAMHMILSGLRIQTYRLRSAGYRLKQGNIPGFCGELTLSSRMAPAILELWKVLLLFSEYAGIGIKTTLGMGGVTVQFNM